MVRWVAVVLKTELHGLGRMRIGGYVAPKQLVRPMFLHNFPLNGLFSDRCWVISELLPLPSLFDVCVKVKRMSKFWISRCKPLTFNFGRALGSHAVWKMSERSQSPECQIRPYDFSRTNPCTQVLGHETLGSAASFQFPHGVLPDPSLLYNKNAYSGITPASAQTFFPFPPVTSDYRGSELQTGDFGQPKYWYPFAAPEYTSQVPGATAATQPTNLSPPIAETREQMKLPDIKTEKDLDEDYSTEIKIQQYPTPQASAMSHGVFYSPAWNPSFWPGITHITPPGSNNQNPSTSSASSPSMSPSPPSNGLPGSTFFSVNTTQAAAGPQTQNPASSTRSSGSSSGGCSDSEEVRTVIELGLQF